MQKLSRQALLKSKAELTRRKEHLLMLVRKRLGSESATPLERVIEISEGTVRIGRWHPSDDSKLETAKLLTQLVRVSTRAQNSKGRG